MILPGKLSVTTCGQHRHADRSRRGDRGAERAERAKFERVALAVGQQDEEFGDARDQTGSCAAVSTLDGVSVAVSGDEFDRASLQLVVIDEPINYFAPGQR